MIIGNGLIAKAFKKSGICFDDALIIASGVSNSSETCVKEFKREEELLRRLIDSCNGSDIIYFSSGSIYSNSNTPYINHKKNMESLICNSKTPSTIIRLANVVGSADNNTMIPFFIKKIKMEEIIYVQRNAQRQFVYIDDVINITRLILDSNIQGTVNIASERSYSASYIIEVLEKFIGQKAVVKFVSGGENYTIPTSDFGLNFAEYGLSKVDYLEQMLEKMHNEL